MGFPIPYAGVLPRLLFTAAISMATIRDLCLSLLESFGIITSHIIHHDPDNYIVNDSARSFPDINYPSHDPYFNPHLHSPADHPLLLRRTAFFQAVQASLPAMLYESLPPIINPCLVQECPPADAMPSSPPSLSASITSLAAPAELAVPSQASNLQRPANSLGLGDSVLVNSMSYLSLSSMSCPSPSSSSSLTSCSHLSPTSSSSSSLCSSTSHVSRIPPKFEQGAQASAIAESDQSIKRIVKFEASSSHNPKTPPGGLSTAYDLQIGQQNPVMPIRPSAAWNATAEAHISQYDQLQKHWPPASTELSFPCSCGATAAISDVDRHLRQRTVTYTLETQALAMRSPISAYFAQEGAAGSSNASKYHLQQRAECAVCLCEFERGEEVRLLPSCRHIFHKDCIDGWILHNHRTCPLCRSSLLTAAIEVQEKMREQELSDQLSAWINSLEQEEGLASQDHHL